MSVSDVNDIPVQLHELHTTAKRLAVSVDTVKRLIDSGDLIAINVGTGTERVSWRIDEAELRRFIKARQILATIKEEASPPREGTPRNSEASVSESA